MNKIAILLKQIVKEDVHLPEICMVRNSNYTGPYIDAEKINTTGFDELNQNPLHTYYKIRLTIDQDPSLPLTYNKPIIGSRVLVIWTEDELPIAIQMNQVGTIVKNYINQTVNVNNTTMIISGTTTVNSYQDITIKDNGSINIEAQTITEKANGITLDSQTGKLTLKNGTVDIKDLFNDISQALNILESITAAFTGTSGTSAAAPIITDLTTKINLLL